MPVKAYNSRTCDVNVDVAHGLSPLEIKLCEGLSRVETCGKSKKRKVSVPVTVLLTTSMVSDINLMISKRQAVAVREDNPYLFARSTGRTSLRGSDCLRKMVSERDAEHPENITSTQLRKHVATMAQVLSLQNHELDLFSKVHGA